jgi:hypothetical protein
MEVIIATTLFGIVLVAILSAYLFVGRNLTRLVNLQQQEVESRRTLRMFTQDLSSASQLTTATTSQVTLTKPAAAATTTVTYTYSSSAGTLVRTESGRTITLLSGVTALNIFYFNEAGEAVTSSTQSVKSVELSYTSASGTATSGTSARYNIVSPRVVLRNKAALQ